VTTLPAKREAYPPGAIEIAPGAHRPRENRKPNHRTHLERNLKKSAKWPTVLPKPLDIVGTWCYNIDNKIKHTQEERR